MLVDSGVLFIAVALAILAGAGAFASFWYLTRQDEKPPFLIKPARTQIPQKLTAPRPNYTVAVLAALPTERLHHACAGLEHILSQSSSAHYMVIPYHGENTRISIFTQAENVLSHADMLVTIGETCTQIAKKAAASISSRKPILFTDIRSERIKQLEEGPDYPYIFGISTKPNYRAKIEKLLKLKKNTQRMLVLHRSRSTHVIRELSELVQVAHSLGVQTQVHYLEQGTQLYKQLESIRDTEQAFDTIMLLPQTLTAQAIQEVVQYSNKNQITFYAQDLDSVTLGASIGAGGQLYYLGQLAAKKLIPILEGKTLWKSDIPIEHAIESYRFHLNRKTMEKQGLRLSKSHLFLLDQGSITYDPLSSRELSYTQAHMHAYEATKINTEESHKADINGAKS